MNYILKIVVLSSLLLINTHAQVKIMNIGDSVSLGRHLRQLQSRMEADGFTNYDFVGEYQSSGFPQDTNRLAYGGARYRDNINGRMVDRGSGLKFEPGVNYGIPVYDPDVILVLGGYNNMAQETVGGGLTSSKNEFINLMGSLVSQAPRAEIFISNITDFHPDRTWGYKRQNVFDFNNFMSDTLGEFAIAGLNINWVDNYADVLHSDTTSDGLHVAQSGHNKIGDNWYEAMTRADIFADSLATPQTSSLSITSVPEPSSTALLGLGALGLIARRRR